MAIVITPAMMAAINIAIEIAITQLSQKVKGMTAQELDNYILTQEKRKFRLLKKIDEA